jgi:hypothetical protein
MCGGLACVRQTPFHAAAHIKHQGDADAGRFAMKISDRPRPSRFKNLEITGGQIADEPPFVIPNNGCDAHHVYTRSKRRYRGLLR